MWKSLDTELPVSEVPLYSELPPAWVSPGQGSSSKLTALHARLATRKLDMLFVNPGVENADHETIADASTDGFVRMLVTTLSS